MHPLFGAGVLYLMEFHLIQVLILFSTAGIAGTLNALAGGGSFVSFPTLLFLRVPPVPANATNTVALLPGLAASTLAYLKRLSVPLRLLIALLVYCGVGVGCGGWIISRNALLSLFALVAVGVGGGGVSFFWGFGKSVPYPGRQG